MRGDLSSFPRAILHIDGDSFFASCEVAKNPRLRGLPVITGRERGIVSACTYEAKRLGIKRGMRLFEVKTLCPSAVILPSDYETYSLFSRRMYEIVRRYTPAVEEYSIDECFADLGGMRRVHRASYPAIAASIQRDLRRELGITFSLGLSCTKVLAKIGSKWRKPDGFTVIPLRESASFLARTPIESVWGIGPQTASLLGKHGVRTALDLARREGRWVTHILAKPGVEIWRELRGELVHELDTEGRRAYRSIQKTKTFTPPSEDRAFIYSQLSKNVENACIKARRWGLVTSRVFFFLKTREFRYHGLEVALPHPTALPHLVLSAVSEHFPRVFRRGVRYRATGIALLALQNASTMQLDLFGDVAREETLRSLFARVDALSRKYGKHAVFLGSSLSAMRGAHRGERGQEPERTHLLFRGETKRRRLGLPLIGEVS